MSEVIGVKFKEGGKVYYFDPNGITAKADEAVIVETARGLECGVVAVANREVAEEEIVKPLKQVVRLATAKDVAQMEENRKREAHAFEVCQQKILDHKMDMKLVDVEYTFDNSKILFYFTADGRVDFRDLVKDLASVFRTRIELRQIGVRDEAKMLGGLGICGRVFCCSSFLSDFQPVSIKMAKEQGLSLNPTKISGTCGRLMCCLKYEQNAYEDLLRTTPRVGAAVNTPEGPGTVSEIINLLTGNLKVKIESGDTFTFKNFMKHELTPLREDSRPAREPREPREPRQQQSQSSQTEQREDDETAQREDKATTPRREDAPRREGGKKPNRGSRPVRRQGAKPGSQNKQPAAPSPENDRH